MSYYGILFPEFWTGATGRAIRAQGGKDAQLLALYLISAPHANMLGLYHLPPAYLLHETGLTRRAIAHAFDVIEAETFAAYDIRAEYVWVTEMARVRLLTGQDHLNKSDNRVTAANRLYATIAPNRFLGPFHAKYGRALHLRSRREGPLDIAPFEGASKGLRSPFEASNRSDQIRSEIRSDQRSEKSSAADASHVPTKKLLKRLAYAVLDSNPALANEPEAFTEEVKVAAARAGVTYGRPPAEIAALHRAVEEVLADRRQRA